MRLGKNLLFFLMWTASFVVAFALPDDPDKTALLGSIIEVVGAVVPAVGNVRQISPIPEVASAYFAVMWILVLIWLPSYFRLSDEQINTYEKATKRRTAFLFFPVMVIALIWLYFFLPPSEPGNVFKAMLYSRFGLGFLGGLGFSGIPFSIRAMIMWIHYLSRVLDEGDESNIKGDS